MHCLMYADGTRINLNQVIGRGLDGVVVLTGDTVLKAPKLYGIYQSGIAKLDEDDCYISYDLENEKCVYARLENTTGIAKCLGTSPNGITLEYCSNGSLEQYMENNEEPELTRKQGWINEIVDAVARCHEKRVLIFDIALRNILLMEDWSIRIVDFANSVLFQLDIDLSEAENEGCTAKLDMLHLGNVIYSVAKWQKFSVDCAMESEWPDRSEMPRLEKIPCGHVIAKCWAQQYRSVQELQRDLKHATGSLNTYISI